MVEAKEKISFEYDEETCQFFVTLDTHMSRQRESLFDSIIDRAEDVLKSEKSRKNIYQYIIHRSSLRNVWQFLQGKTDDTMVRVLVGSGAPRLKGLRIIPPEDQGLARLILPRDPDAVRSWQWQWLNCAIKMAFVQLKIDYPISTAEIQYYLQQAKRGRYVNEQMDLILHPLSPPARRGKDFELKLNNQGNWVELLVFNSQCIDHPEFISAACKQAEEIMTKEPFIPGMAHHILFRDLHDQLDEVRSGPSILGIGLPLRFLVAFKIPVISKDNESSAVESIYQQAKLSLQRDPKSERLFVAANLGLSREVWPQLADRLHHLFNRLSFERRKQSDKHKEYLLVFSLFPFTQSAMFPLSPTLKITPSSYSWLIWVIREMVKFDDFKLDPQWVSSRLALPVPQQLIEQTIELIVNKKMIVLDPNTDRYQQSVETLLTPDEVSGAAIARHYQELFEITPTALKLAQNERRAIRCLRLRLTPREFWRLRAFVSRFSQDCLKVEDQVRDCQEVYHLGFLFFPVCLPKADKKVNLAS